MDNEKLPDNIIWHQSGINKTGEPFIQLLHGNQIVGQMTPQEAREHAQAVVEAAEAAEQDAFLWAFAHEKIGLNDQQAFGIIMNFREYRKRTTGKSQGPTRATDWVMPTEAGL